jgi:aryl-alcohol dehydrogenase-like predicted oxidoreductase
MSEYGQRLPAGVAAAGDVVNYPGKMKTRKIADLEVSAVGLGGMPLSIAGRPDRDQAIAVIRAAVDAGMTLIDTADVYCLDDDDIGHNERLIAEALDGVSTEVVVATKGGLRRPGGAWTTDGRPDRLREACEASLEALGRKVIDLYQLHAPDDDVPFADSVGALAQLRAEGKIRHVGLSNVDVAQIEEAAGIVEIASVQNRCNLFDTKSFKNGVIDHCLESGIAFLPHSPVGGHQGHARTTEDSEVVEIAKAAGCTPHQVLIAWLLALGDEVIPIPGASKISSVESSAAAADIELPADAIRALDRRARARTGEP